MIDKFKSKIWDNPPLRFIFLVAVLYGGYELVNYVGTNTSLSRYWLHIKLLVVYSAVDGASLLMKIFGSEIVERTDGRFLEIVGGQPVKVGIPCSAFEIFAIWVVLILAYPASLKARAIAIPFGILCIHFINILRITGLVLVAKNWPQYMYINHHYVFKGVAYVLVIVLFIQYMNRLGKSKKKSSE